MRVLVMGAGAVGGYFGAKLVRAGHEVWFIGRGERLRAMRTTGLKVESIDGDFDVAPLRATNDTSVVGPVDLVLFTVKSTQTREAAEALVPVVRDHTTVLAIQNGVDNEELLEEVLGADRIVPGVAVIGVAMPEPGRVVHTNNGSITIGEPSGEETERVRLISKTLREAGVETRVSTHIRSIKWRKLVWNAAFNPIAALTGGRVLQLIEDDDTRELAEVAMREAIAVGVALGLDVADYDLARATQRNPQWALSKTSMLQDLERGRPTEIEALTGAVVRYGEETGVPTPVSRTLLRLVRAKGRDVVKDQ
jgi:2-dehydropantoate 2-reductase